MKKIRKIVRYSSVAIVTLLMVIGNVQGFVEYGSNATCVDEGQFQDSTYTLYSTTPIILSNGDYVSGLAYLAGGFHTDLTVSSTYNFKNVAFPIENDIYLRDNNIINVTGDLHISTTSFVATSKFTMTSPNNSFTLTLESDLSLPDKRILFGKNCTIDGQGHTLTFDANTIIATSPNILLLKNMIIKGLTGTTQFGYCSGGVTLQNCIIDVPVSTLFTYNAGPITIIDDVLIRGGGTFKFTTANSSLTINALSTLFIDQDTTLEYGVVDDNSKLVMAANTSTIHINGGTLKADAGVATQGLQLATGRLFFENKCILDNGENDEVVNAIKLGDGTNDLEVKVLSGACVEVNGYVFHNPSVS